MDGCCRDCFSQGKGDGEGGAATFSFATGFDDTTMQLDKVAGDRKTKAEAAGGSAAHCFCLAEPIKDIRQELGIDAAAGIDH